MMRVHGSLPPSQGNRGRTPTQFIGIARRHLEHRERFTSDSANVHPHLYEGSQQAG
jgi:hypothetical protein